MSSVIIKDEYLPIEIQGGAPSAPRAELPGQQELEFEDPRIEACRKFVRVANEYYMEAEFLPGHEGLEDKMGKALDAILAALGMKI